jgi:hypothetical protein
MLAEGQKAETMHGILTDVYKAAANMVGTTARCYGRMSQDTDLKLHCQPADRAKGLILVLNILL